MAKVIGLFLGENKEFVILDEAIYDTNQFYVEEFLIILLPNGIPPRKFILKRKLSNVCNGTRIIFRDFKGFIIHAEIIVGQHVGNHVFLLCIPLILANDEGYPFKFKRKQFSRYICLMMTINKAQEQTMPTVGIYLPENVFSHGQLYVALSRGVSMQITQVLAVYILDMLILHVNILV
ncbi:uncharacterized protein LOC111380356 [Olea europaea var. sylvestris]|uniref:uncharacterized protein LOC111380356 n=1 Tax=Olea europaea var. sylvestris TaxID=158386 RepID=UPI000C1D69B9|nr:uncharacterized protein LOC111380356 [Olea europaea var. sylvestris]